MPVAERRATAHWEGNLNEGKGTFSVASGAISDLPITWAARTERSNGMTSPEELIAAAHASCFSMALSNNLNKGGNPPEKLTVTAKCTLDRIDGKLKITTMDLSVVGKVPGIDAEAFRTAADETGKGCPVSGALIGNVEINVHAELERG
jgi:osmotically inducible protein OsmC